jgi:methyl-accepting chemotaxis protein
VDITIGKRLSLTLCLVLFALVFVSLFGFWNLYRAQQRFDLVQTDVVPGLINLGETQQAMTNVRIGAYRHAISTGATEKSQAEARIREADKEFDLLVDQYEKEDVRGDPEDQRLVEADRKNIFAYRQAREGFFETSRSNDLAGATRQLLSGPLDQTSKAVRDGLNAHVAYNIKESIRVRDENDEAYTIALWILTIVTAVILILTIWLSIRLYMVIAGGLSQICGTLGYVSQSLDLTTRAPTVRMDEVGRSAAAFNQLMDSFAQALSSIRVSTDSITIATKEIAIGNTDLSARTEEQAASLEETASSMTQLTETVVQNAANARQASMLATKATGMADVGNDAVEGMVGTIGRISESSKKISEITGLIEGIAFQTNILALNAAVEAARAGEQGRGFAVVASEVRSLAQRSSAAAKEIKGLIESSVALVQEGSRQAVDVGATMGEVKQAIKQVSDIVGEIAAASEEQSRGIEQVNQAVNQMDEVTQQNATLVEQSAVAAQSLEEQAMKLKDAVSVFRLVNAGQSASRTAARKNQPTLSAPENSATRRVRPARPAVPVAVMGSLSIVGAAVEPTTGNAEWREF